MKRIIVKIVMSFAILISTVLNSFAAVVSDNDGSAFITKAEFDSLKNNFQSLIDSYNSSIDSKIDSAIASYLAGIKLSSTEQRSNISYFSDGILAVVSYSNIDWSEGTMGWAFDWIRAGASSSLSGDDGNGAAYISLTKSASPFMDTAVTNVDETNKKAIWKGKVKNKQFFHGDTQDIYRNGPIASWFGNCSNIYLHHYTGLEAISNVDLNNVATQVACFASGQTSSGHQQTFPINTGYATLWREEMGTSLEHIICTPATQQYVRFANFDKINDWSNDTTRDSGHTVLTTPAGVFDNGVWRVYTRTGSGTAKQHAGTCYVNGTQRSYTNYHSYKPYFGFSKNVDDWSYIATKDYDSYIDDMLIYHPSLNYKSFTENGTSKKHLMVNAGAPIIFANKDEGITLPLEFGDKTKDYDVWIKIGSFNSSTSPTADSGCLSTSDVYKGNYGATTHATSGYAAKSIKIESGQGVLSFKMPIDGYIFIKWSISNSSSPTAGGTYMPSSSVTVLSAE